MTASTPVARPTEPERLSAKETFVRVANARWFHCVALGAIAVLVHSPALQGQRIWDDQYLAHDNPFIKSPLLIPESFRHYLFLDSLSAHYRPIQNISYIFDYFLWNTDEFGFHLTNVLFHAGSGILLYFLLRQLLVSLILRRSPSSARNRMLQKRPWISFGAFLLALLWIVHPVHSAAVDYISGRADSLAFFFAASAWLCYLRAQRTPGRGMRAALHCLAATNGLLALLSREIACIWILIFIVHLFWIEKRIPLRSRAVAAICCILLVGIYAGLRELPGERAASPSQSYWTAPVRAVLMARALGDYARLMIFPGNLHMERTVVDSIEWRSNADWRRTISPEYLSILGLGLLAVLAHGAARAGRGQGLRVFGAGWFIAAYFPVSNIVQLNATVAEHWLYLPLVGFLIFLLGSAIELPVRYRRATSAVAFIIAIALSARSFVRSGDWANEETFYQRTLVAAGETPRVVTNLAQVYAGRGDYAAAEKLLRGVLQITRDYPTARINLGNVLLHEGKSAEAEALFHSLFNADAQLRQEYPRTWISAVNLACVRHRAGDDTGAFAVLGSARATYPDVWELVSYEAELRRETQAPEAALVLVENFSRQHWWHYGAAVAAGRLYAQLGRIDLADDALSRASRLDVHDAEALNLLAAIKLRQNNLEEALRAQRRAVKRQPDQPSQYLLLSDILDRMGLRDQARAALTQASRLRALVENSAPQSL
jgi:protein O-mannosyl-transferase